MRLLAQRRAQAAARRWATARSLKFTLLLLAGLSGAIVVENQQATHERDLLDRLGRIEQELTSPSAAPSQADALTPEQRALATLLASPGALDPSATDAVSGALEEAGAAREAHDPTRLNTALGRLDHQVVQATGTAQRRLRRHLVTLRGALALTLLVLLGAQAYLARSTRRLLSPPLVLTTALVVVGLARVGVQAAPGGSVEAVMTTALALAAFGLWRRWREVS